MEEKDERFKWDLNRYYKDLEEFDKDFEDKKLLYVDAFDKFAGKLGDKKVLLEYLNLQAKMILDLEKIEMYVFCRQDLNKDDGEIAKRADMFDLFDEQLNLKLVPLATELSRQSMDFLNECINDPEFKDFKMKLIKIRDRRKHVLSTEEENIFALVSSPLSGYSEVYRQAMDKDKKYKPVIVDGKEEKLTDANILTFLTNENRDVRKQSSYNMTEGLNNVANSAITAYIYKLKADCADLKIRKYDSVLSSSLESEHIPESVYRTLLKVVNDNVDFKEKFHSIRRRALGFKNYYSFDCYLPIVKGIDRKYSIDEQFEILKKALLPLGEEYVKNIDFAVNNHWFDLYPEDCKSNRTFATFDYSMKQPYVYMQQNYDIESLLALAHEFGHAVNFNYSMKKQPRSNASVYTYTAEITSTTNELLVNKYLLENTNNIDEKIYFLEKLISNFIGTVVTQTLYTEFEDFAYGLVENGKPITVDILCEKWYELLQKYNGKAFDKCVDMEKFKKGISFIEIHHFMYYTYYVFNYATSFTCAYIIASKILKGDKELKAKYLEFLSKGSSSFPDDQVKEMGIDLSDVKTYETMFSEMNEMLNELDALVELKQMRSKTVDKLKKSEDAKSFVQAKKEHKEKCLVEQILQKN